MPASPMLPNWNLGKKNASNNRMKKEKSIEEMEREAAEWRDRLEAEGLLKVPAARESLAQFEAKINFLKEKKTKRPGK